MTLHIIGIGLGDEQDITLRGLNTVKKCYKVYLETYTSKLNCDIPKLEELYGKKIIPANRELVEKKAELILNDAKGSDIAFLVVGDPMSATTHLDLMMRAKEKGIAVDVIFNASIMTAVGLTGLELYKFGKTTSIPFPTQSFNPETAYEVIKMNKANGLHTLILLDLRPEQDKYMTVNQAISILLGIEDKRKEKVFNEDTLIVGCARLGNNDYRIKSGTVQELMNKDFGKPLHCLVVVGNLHFMEEEALKQWK